MPYVLLYTNYAYAMRGNICYNTAWLLTGITDQAGEISAEKVLAIEAQIDRCLKQPAATAAKSVKCHLSLQEVSLFIAETVLEQ